MLPALALGAPMATSSKARIIHEDFRISASPKTRAFTDWNRECEESACAEESRQAKCYSKSRKGSTGTPVGQSFVSVVLSERCTELVQIVPEVKMASIKTPERHFPCVSSCCGHHTQNYGMPSSALPSLSVGVRCVRAEMRKASQLSDSPVPANLAM